MNLVGVEAARGAGSGPAAARGAGRGVRAARGRGKGGARGDREVRGEDGDRVRRFLGHICYLVPECCELCTRGRVTSSKVTKDTREISFLFLFFLSFF